MYHHHHISHDKSTVERMPFPIHCMIAYCYFLSCFFLKISLSHLSTLCQATFYFVYRYTGISQLFFRLNKSHKGDIKHWHITILTWIQRSMYMSNFRNKFNFNFTNSLNGKLWCEIMRLSNLICSSTESCKIYLADKHTHKKIISIYECVCVCLCKIMKYIHYFIHASCWWTQFIID